MDYLHTHPDAVVQFHASNMILYIESDAAYLVLPQARSCVARITLCVDDFGIQYFSKADAKHLINVIQDTYECSIDWEGTQYCGLTLAWNYPEGYVNISMPGYLKKVLKKFNHKPPKRPEHAPHDWKAPIYG